MSREQAERWTKGSQYQGDVYHITKGVANERSIAANGFDLSKKKFGRMWGDGVYVGTDAETAEMYKDWTGPGARKLAIRTDVRNMLTFVIDRGDLNEVDIIVQGLGIDKRTASNLWSKTRREGDGLTKILSGAGYDALQIVDKLEQAAGGNQIVIFDPKKVVVIK
jgi:hypothetical protein